MCVYFPRCQAESEFKTTEIKARGLMQSSLPRAKLVASCLLPSGRNSSKCPMAVSASLNHPQLIPLDDKTPFSHLKAFMSHSLQGRTNIRDLQERLLCSSPIEVVIMKSGPLGFVFSRLKARRSSSLDCIVNWH